MPAAPKVFISYSHDSEAHKARVLTLADRLRHAGGIEAIIDRYVEPFPPEGWPAWCWWQIEQADFVVIVCTEVYHRRVTNKEEAGKGHGVCWEAPIIFQLLYEQGSVSKRFVPVLFADGSQDHVPTPVRKFGRFYVDTPEGWEQLLRHLADKPRTPAPPIGIPRELPPAARPGLAATPVGAERPESAEPALSQPHLRVEDIFAGREKELGELADCLFPASGKRRPVAVVGMGGVGKSYLVDRFYWQNAARFPGGYVRVALDAAKPGTADDLLATIADRLKLPAADRGALAARLLAPLTLLHVENVDTLEAGKLIGEAVTRLAGCALVASARLRTLGAGGGWGRVEVEPFDEAPALDQLAQELGTDAPPRDGPSAAAPSPRPSPARGEQGRTHSLSLDGRGWRATARRVRAGNNTLDVEALRRLVRALGRLPLALHLAAGYLRMGDSPEIFLDRLRAKGLALEPIDPSDPTFHERSREVLAKTFELSLDALGREGGKRAKRWRAAFDALGFTPAAGFGESLGAAIAGLAPDEFRNLTFAAIRLSLLERVARSGGRSAFRLHPLLAELGRARAKKDPVIARMTEWFVARLPEGGEDQGRRWQEVHDETAALIEWLPQVPAAERRRIVEAAMQYASFVGPFHAWSRLCEEALAQEQDEGARSNLMWVLVQVALRAGLPDRALAAAEEKRELDLGRGAGREAAISAVLKADVLAARGDLDEALRILRDEVLPAFEEVGDVRSKAATMGKIADVLAARGDLDEALRIRREEELPVYERLGDVQAKAVTMGKIADVLADRGDLDEALRIRREEQLPVYERLGDVQAKAVTMGKIATALADQGELEEAIRIQKEDVLPVFARLGDRKELLTGRWWLASHLLHRRLPGDDREAEQLLCLALAGAREMRLPEAQQIEAFLKSYGLSCD